MSKTIKTTLLLLAAAILFAGCSNSSGGSKSDPEKETSPSAGSEQNPGGSSGTSTMPAFPKASANTTTNAINLSDGVWHIDSKTSMTTTTKMKVSGVEDSQTEKKTLREHIELKVTGNKVEVIKAIEQTDDEPTVDRTEEMKNVYKTKSDAEDPDLASHNESSQGSMSGMTTGITPTSTTIKKNADGSEYLVNIVLNFSLQDILTASDPEVQKMAAMLAGMGITDMIVDSTTDVIYKKQS